DRGGDDRIADIGVDLHQEVAADDHRLGFRVVDVVRDDGAAAGDLVAHEFRRHLVRDAGAEGFADVDPLGQLVAAEVFPDRDVLHLGGDDAPLGVGVLRHRLPGLGAQYLAVGAVEYRDHAFFTTLQPVVFRLDAAAAAFLDIAARQDPRAAQLRQPGAD